MKWDAGRAGARLLCASVALWLGAACGAELPGFPGEADGGAGAGGEAGSAGAGGGGSAGGGGAAGTGGGPGAPTCADVCKYQFDHACANAMVLGPSEAACTSQCEQTGGMPAACMICLANDCVQACQTPCVGSVGGTDLSPSCSELLDCCQSPGLPDPDRNACFMTVSFGTDPQCAQALAYYQNSGSCL